MLVKAGERAPSFNLVDIDTGSTLMDPWKDGAVALAFFKVTCPVCQMTAPKVQALADGGARVVAIGEDPAPKLASYAERYGQRVPTVTEPPPYPVSDAYGVSSVPTLIVVGEDGVVQQSVGSWDRERWNAAAAALGAPPISVEGDGLPSFRPG